MRATLPPGVHPQTKFANVWYATERNAMLSLLADENLDGNIIRGVLRRVEGLSLIRVQDMGLSGSDDQTILQKAAEQKRVLVTHDVQTVTRFAYERIDAGLPMPGVIEVISSAPIGSLVEELALIVECYEDGELEGQVLYLPL
jgi:predicted nuclease of predicted toxin-antitoxin system